MACVQTQPLKFRFLCSSVGLLPTRMYDAHVCVHVLLSAMYRRESKRWNLYAYRTYSSNYIIRQTQQGCAMAQAISHRPLTVEARVTPYWVCGGQSSPGTAFYLNSSLLPWQYNSTIALLSHILSGRRTTGPLIVADQRHSLTRST
jgi:hypothetical protein